ncbi:MAG: PDZ domain-containing protein [Planctomycetota bacterium]
MIVAGRTVALGTWITPPVWVSGDTRTDGYVLTKASETTGEPVRIATHDGRLHDAHAVATDRAADLRLLRFRIPADSKLTTFDLSAKQDDAETQSPPGTFVVVPTPNDVAYTGIVAGPRRAIPSDAKMGVFFADGTARPLVRAVQAGSGADAAGIQRGDVVIALDGIATATPLAVIEALQVKPRYPGDRIDVLVQGSRQPEPITLTVELGRSAPEGNTRERRLELSEHNAAPSSQRASGFPPCLPTDAPVPAHHCGGPALTAEPSAGSEKVLLGLVVARTGRTETLILPTAQLREALERMRPR